jgi:hypothetical protein
MFNDLLNDLNVEHNEIFAYADDLAVNNCGEEILKRTLIIIEE